MTINVIRTLREYLGMKQGQLSKMAGLMQGDLSEMETKAPYGWIEKYVRVADALEVPVHALAANDFAAIPMSFFEKHPEPEYLPEPQKAEHAMGRAGEELILRQERERLEDISPALARMVMPYFKMKIPSPGYDILSFDNNGRPVAVEVKTTVGGVGSGFRLTENEYKAATQLIEEKIEYVICRINKWGKPEQTQERIPFQDFIEGGRVRPADYFCTMKDKSVISGITFYRMLREIPQWELAEELGIVQTQLSAYEHGVKGCPTPTYIKLSEVLGTSIDNLLQDYRLEDDRYVQ